jgi:hypothetical protein
MKDYMIHTLPKPVVIVVASFLYNTWRVRNIARISKRFEKEKG